MRGVNIGRVMGFSIGEKGVQIRLEIVGEYGVPLDSKVELRSAGMLGGMVATVVPGVSPRRARYGDSLEGAPQEQVMDAAKALVDRAGKAMDRVDAMMSDAFVKDVQGSGAEAHDMLKNLSETVKEQRAEIKKLEDSLLKNSQGLEKVTNGPELERALKRLDAMTERTDKLVASMNKSAESVQQLLARVERGEGTLGKLSKDEAMYNELNETVKSFRQTSKDLSELMQDIKKNPKKYFKFSVF
jgi:phospholipid/cholesterol/gamma-HCH transport system substrate-binding protein